MDEITSKVASTLTFCIAKREQSKGPVGIQCCSYHFWQGIKKKKEVLRKEFWV